MSDKNMKATYEKSVESRKTRPILDLSRTVARSLFVCKSRPWEAISGISEFIRESGRSLPFDEYDEIADDVWVHVSAYLSPTCKIESPAIICGGAKICHFSSVSSSVIGSFSYVGECTEVKNSILFDRSRLCGMNCFLHSVLGYSSIIGQGTTVPDKRMDGMSVSFDMPEGIYISGRTQMGSVICDEVKVGASCVINPGTVIDTGAKIYPLTSIVGYIYPYTSAE